MIIGAGMAGLSASLRLLQRGFEVTLVEQDDFMGGMMRACTFPDEDTGDRHEHSYHMVTNWYHNLWDIIDELGLRKHFSPRNGFAFLSPGEKPKHLNGVGSPVNLIRNVFSGVAPPADLFIYVYSMIDLLSTRLQGRGYLGDFSVNGFLAARPYITERAALLHQRVWETVWGIPSYDASAVSYKSFLKYGNFRPNPGMWLFNTNKYDALIGPIEQKLRSFGDRFRFLPLTVIEELQLDGHGNVETVRVVHADRSPSLWPDDWQRTGTEVLHRRGRPDPGRHAGDAGPPGHGCGVRP